MKNKLPIVLFTLSTIILNAGDFSVPSAFKYQTINNSGIATEFISDEYTTKLYADYSETMNAQSPHVGIVVTLDEEYRGILNIQSTYTDHNLTAAIYKGNELIAFSDIVLIDGNKVIDVSSDKDNDALLDYKEAKINLDINSNDSDNDGYLDSEEIGDIDNPRDSDGDEIIDALDLDSDNDGMSDSDEKKYGFNPISNDASNDNDGDGVNNITEIKAGTDPTDKNDYPKTDMTNQEKALFTILLNSNTQLDNEANDVTINIPAIFMLEALNREETEQ